MPHSPDYHELTRMVRQLREALVLTRSPNFKFLTFSPPGHFYSPIPDIASIKSDSYRLFDPNSAEIAGLHLNESGQLELVERFSAFKSKIPWPADGRDPRFRYHFDNIYFSYGDAVSLFGLMKEFRPGRVIEVGSGYSSAAMLDIDELFLGRSTSFTFIEPHPDRLKDLLKDEDWARVSILEHPVQDSSISDFTALKKNDILFIDSSHVSKAGSDVGYLINLVLPHLAPGVIIHFHDILWPFEYPGKWLTAGRAWNEAYLLLAFLQYNSAFEILFFNSYLEKHHRKLLRRKLPLMLRQPSSKMTFGNSSLWLRKSENPPG
jgi:hypothetical protein